MRRVKWTPRNGKPGRGPGRSGRGRGSLRLLEHPVGAAKRDDADVEVGACERGDPVGLEPGARHERARTGVLASSRTVRPSPSRSIRSMRVRARCRPSAPQQLAHPLGDEPKSTTPVSGTWRARTPRTFGSIPRNSASSSSTRPSMPVPGSAPLQLGEPVELGLVDRDDELAAPLRAGSRAPGRTSRAGPSLAAQRRLQRAGRVVEAGMHDSRVVAALVDRDRRFLVEQRQPKARRSLEQRERRGKPEDAAPDDDDVRVHAELSAASRPGRE